MSINKYEKMIIRAFFAGFFTISAWTLLEVVNQGRDIASIKTAISYLSGKGTSDETAQK